MNGNVSTSPSRYAFSRRITSDKFDRWISGVVCRPRFSKSSREYSRMHRPSRTRPALPAR